MYPVIRDGNRVLLAPRDRPVRRGDIVVVRFGQRLVLHRVTRVMDGRLILRGDASAEPDPIVATGDVVGLAIACDDGRGVRGLIPTLRFGPRALVRQLSAEVHRYLRGTAMARAWWAIRDRRAIDNGGDRSGVRDVAPD